MSEECRVCKGTRKIKWDMSEGSKPYIVYVDCPFCKTKEDIMSEKLTSHDVMGFLLSARGDGGWSVEETHKNLMAAIEADREAIRAETREELLRDHFKIGEAISYDSATDASERNGHVRIVDDMSQDGGDEYFVQWEHNARRPPKKRPKTEEEMLNNVIYRLETWEAVARGLARLGSLAAVCRDLGIDTEVDE